MQAVSFEQLVLAAALLFSFYAQSWPAALVTIALAAVYAFQFFLARQKLDASAQLLKRISDLEDSVRTQSIAKNFR